MVSTTLFRKILNWEIKDFIALSQYSSVFQLMHAYKEKNLKKLILRCRVDAYHHLYEGIPLEKTLTQFYREELKNG